MNNYEMAGVDTIMGTHLKYYQNHKSANCAPTKTE